MDLPADAEMLAIGRRPFMRAGVLREAMALNGQGGSENDAAIKHALNLVDLSHLTERLDEGGDWGDAMNGAELQRLAFARLLLLRPNWVLMGDATDALDPASAEALLKLVGEQLPEAAILLIGQHTGAPEAFHRRLTLERSTGGEVLLNEVHGRRQAARLPKKRPLKVVDWLRQGYGP